MLKIFVDDKIIYLINSTDLFPVNSNSIVFNVQCMEELIVAFNLLSTQKQVKEIFFYNQNFETIYDLFSSLFILVEAAGGIVKNKQDEILFIFRNEKWDLPKGKMEKNELPENCAVREVEEECGINGVLINKKLLQTYHIYKLGEKQILKRTYWYEMTCSPLSLLIPQTNEGITEVKWISKNDFNEVKRNTYPLILDVLKGNSLNREDRDDA